VFLISAGLMLTSVITIVALVREHARPAPVAKPAPVAAPKGTTAIARLKGGALASIADRNTFVLVVTLAANSFAIAVLSPVLSLYIRDLVGDAPNLGTIAGAVMSVAAFTSSVSAVILGRLGDRIGQRQVLIACVIGAALIHVPQAMVTHPTQLLVLRGIQGIFMGGIMPTANALLAYATPVARRGAVFGFGHSAGAAGRAVGPTLGAAVSGLWGMGSAFLVTAGVFGVMAAMVAALVRVPAHAVAPEAERAPVLTSTMLKRPRDAG